FWHGLAEKINRLWLELSRRLGHFSSSLLLGICFYCLLTPLAWLYRIFHPDDLDLRKGKESYFHKHTVEFDQNYFERLW
ncbi:hypothetical protein HOF92_10060, partial [bacterium]|nr:hypothetical protein [bacterium]